MEIYKHMFPASSGDCILVEVHGRMLLVDGGYVSTYNKYLKPYLSFRANKPVIDIVVATHIDHDHIVDLLSFIEGNSNAMNPNMAHVKQVWYNNGYSQLSGEKLSRR